MDAVLDSNFTINLHVYFALYKHLNHEQWMEFWILQMAKIPIKCLLVDDTIFFIFKQVVAQIKGLTAETEEKKKEKK